MYLLEYSKCLKQLNRNIEYVLIMIKEIGNKLFFNNFLFH